MEENIRIEETHIGGIHTDGRNTNGINTDGRNTNGINTDGINIEMCKTWSATVYTSGSYERVCDVMQEYALKHPICVSVEKVTYVYKGGREEGVAVGIKHYPRFPKNNTEEMENITIGVAMHLLVSLHQDSLMMVMPERTIRVSRREGEKVSVH